MKVLKYLPKYVLPYGVVFPFFTTNVDNLRPVGLDQAAGYYDCSGLRPSACVRANTVVMSLCTGLREGVERGTIGESGGGADWNIREDSFIAPLYYCCCSVVLYAPW